MRKNVTPGQKMTMQQVYGYLAQRGVPKHMIQMIQMSLIYDAITEGNDMKYDRIFTGIAIALRKECGWGAERILRVLRKFDEVCGSVLEKDLEGEELANWTKLMEWLKEETGIVIHTGEDTRLICEVSRE